MITQMAYLQHTHINKPKHTIYTDVATLIQKHYFHPYYQSHLQQANGSADSAGLRHTRPEAQGGFMSVQDLIVRMQLKHVIRIVYDKSSLLPQLLTRM